jgi:hypothetical protein
MHMQAFAARPWSFADLIVMRESTTMNRGGEIRLQVRKARPVRLLAVASAEPNAEFFSLRKIGADDP